MTDKKDTGEIESPVDGPMPDWLKVASSSKGSSMDESQVPDWLRSIRAGQDSDPEAKSAPVPPPPSSPVASAASESDDGMSDLERLLAEEGIDLNTVSEERPHPNRNRRRRQNPRRLNPLLLRHPSLSQLQSQLLQSRRNPLMMIRW